MYIWLVLLVFVAWLLLAGGVIVGWWSRLYGWFSALSVAGAITAAALAFVLFYGPYWDVIYRVIVQPG